MNEILKIDIRGKYLYILDSKGNHLAYFEHFKDKSDPNNVIKISVEDLKGDKFIKKNNYSIQDANVYWFSKRSLRRKFMIVEEKIGAFSYLILIIPNSLKIN